MAIGPSIYQIILVMEVSNIFTINDLRNKRKLSTRKKIV